MSTQTKNAKSVSTKDYFAQRAKRMDSAEADAQAASIESGEQSISPANAETSGHTSPECGGEIMSVSAAAPIRGGDVIKSSIEAPVPTGDVDEQTMHEIIGAPIEADDVSVHTSHSTPDPDGEASATLTTTPNVEVGTTERDAPVPVNENNKTGARPSIAESTETGIGIVSTASSAHTGGSEPSVQTEHTAPATPAISTVSTEPSETTVPTPQTAIIESSTNSSDALNSNDTAPTVPTLDTEPTRRTVKQLKSDLNEYRRRYMQIPRIADRKPVFVSRSTRDRLDRIMRLLGERGMSVSGLIENIALHHLETHEADIEYWRKM